jgi:hypothetical protein
MATRKDDCFIETYASDSGIDSKFITLSLTIKLPEEEPYEEFDSAANDGKLLTGSAARALVGSPNGADVLLFLSNGNTIFAHAMYLRRNPYFNGQMNFKTAATDTTSGPSNKMSLKILKVCLALI